MSGCMSCSLRIINGECTGLGLFGTKKVVIPKERKNRKGEGIQHFWTSCNSTGTVLHSPLIPLILY